MVQEGPVIVVADQLQQSLRLADKLRPAVHVAQLEAACQFADQVFGQCGGTADACFEDSLAFFPDQRVRIMLFRQQQKAQQVALINYRQGNFERLPGGCSTGPITIETKHHGVADAEQSFKVFRRRGGAQGRDGIGDASLVKADYVHITFHHHQLL